MARRDAAAANDGRLARAKAEMPLHREEDGVSKSSIGANWVGDGQKSTSAGGNSPLEHLDDGEGRTLDGGCGRVRRDGFGGEEGNGFENLSMSFRLEAAELPTRHVTLCVGQIVGRPRLLAVCRENTLSC